MLAKASLKRPKDCQDTASTRAPGPDTVPSRVKRVTIIDVDDVPLAKRRATAPSKVQTVKLKQSTVAPPTASGAGAASTGAPSSSSASVVVPRQPGNKIAPFTGHVTAKTLLREIFSDEITLEAIYTRWRCSSDGDISYSLMLRKLWTTLFDTPLNLMIVRTVITTHQHGTMAVDFADMGNHAIAMLIALLERGVDDPGAYTCASERFVKKTSFVRFRTEPSDADVVVYDPAELFLRFVDMDLAMTTDAVGVALLLDTLSHLTSSLVCTRADLKDAERNLAMWLNAQVRTMYQVVLSNPSFCIGVGNVLRGAWLSKQKEQKT